MSWGSWNPWDPAKAMGPPPDAQPGTLVKADLRIRPVLIGTTNKPYYVRDFIFTVPTGECFSLNPLGQSEPVTSTHVVTRYRMWRGDAPSVEAEVKMLIELIEEMNDGEAA